MIRPSQWYVWMRNRSHSMLMCGRHSRPHPVELPNATANIKGVGTANAFCAVEPKAGRHFTWPTPDRSADQFAQVRFDLAMNYPTATTIHLVMDNLNTQCRKSLAKLYGEDLGGEIWDRFTVHYTPTHGSWLNQAEIEISLFARQCLGKRRIPTLCAFRREANAWNRRMNHKKVKINWGFTRKKARAKFGYKKNGSMQSKT